MTEMTEMTDTRVNSPEEKNLETIGNSVICVISVIGYFDGLCEPARPGGRRNPGGCACGGWHVEPCGEFSGLEAGLSGCRHYRTGQGATNNVAEYEAALDCLRAIYAAGYRGPVILRGDSQLVVKQYSGEWACNPAHLQELRGKLRHAATFFESLQLEWVPREENSRADALSREAYRKHTGMVTV